MEGLLDADLGRHASAQKLRVSSMCPTTFASTHSCLLFPHWMRNVCWWSVRHSQRPGNQYREDTVYHLAVEARHISFHLPRSLSTAHLYACWCNLCVLTQISLHFSSQCHGQPCLYSFCYDPRYRTSSGPSRSRANVVRESTPFSGRVRPYWPLITGSNIVE